MTNERRERERERAKNILNQKLLEEKYFLQKIIKVY
jgi:hypothetical protein